MGQLLHRRTSKNKQEQARTSKQIKHNTWRPTAIDKIARTAKTGHASSSPGADDPERHGRGRLWWSNSPRPICQEPRKREGDVESQGQNKFFLLTLALVPINHYCHQVQRTSSSQSSASPGRSVHSSPSCLWFQSWVRRVLGVGSSWRPQ